MRGLFFAPRAVANRVLLWLPLFETIDLLIIRIYGIVDLV